ncbi:MAG: antibiotic biosynthesis monooxygenase [Oscillospiraceae bacterium]|nr:antibiotic biosynthesis monooxygenase [Oscillospiraceae bacterium]
MLTWLVTYHCKPGQREAFRKAISELGVRETSTHESGNLGYDYFLSEADPDALLLVERWTDSASQAAHTWTETFSALQELKARHCDEVEIDKYERPD